MTRQTSDEQRSALEAGPALTAWMVASLTRARFKLAQMRWGGRDRGVSFGVSPQLLAFLHSKLTIVPRVKQARTRR